MKKYRIYCLINPLNNQPFYVGVTSRKLKIRLQWHLSTHKHTHGGGKIYNERAALISEILNAGLNPIIKLLRMTTFELIDYREEYYYLKFTGQGFKLLQRHDKFKYTNTFKKFGIL